MSDHFRNVRKGMNDHFREVGNMIRDTPISDTPISDSTAHNIAELGMLCRRLERLAAVRLGYITQLETEKDALREDILLWGDNLRLQQRINRLEEENDALRADLLLWNEKESK